MTLAECEIGKKYKICSLNCNEELKRRFLDLGLVSFTEVVPMYKAPFGDLVAYHIRGTVIAIRKEDSKYISVM